MAKKSTRRVAFVDPVDWPEWMDDNVNWKLLQACTVRHVPIAREALSQGADVNCRRFDDLTPLHIATEHNDTELIQLLCNQPSIDIEAKTMHGLTPLHEAASLGHSRAIQTLLDNGAVVNCTDKLGRQPLHYAALQRDVKSATILLANNANVNVYDVFDESPLYISVIRTSFSPMIKLLLSHGATVNSAPRQKSLGLLLEAVLGMTNASDINVLEILFQNGADVNTTDSVGLRTPLHIVAMTGNVQLATYLIEKGADLYRKNRAGRTPMEVAEICRNFEIARIINNSVSVGLRVHRTSSVTDLTSVHSLLFEHPRDTHASNGTM